MELTTIAGPSGAQDYFSGIQLHIESVQETLMHDEDLVVYYESLCGTLITLDKIIQYPHLQLCILEGEEPSGDRNHVLMREEQLRILLRISKRRRDEWREPRPPFTVEIRRE